MVVYVGNLSQTGNPKLSDRLPNSRGVMMLAAVAKCSRCAAVVNTHWSTCLVCRTPVEAKNIRADAIIIAESPSAPLLPGWLITWRDRDGRLRGGCDDREAGTVKECRWNQHGWTVSLMDGQRLPLSGIRSVGKTDHRGCVVAAWTVREHGADGNGALLK
jgi:hypothetical protein